MLSTIKNKLRDKKYGEPIVVVSGLPRSGTSMMMKMLDSAGLEIMTDGERKADIDNPKGYYEYERVKDLEKEQDKSYVRAARGKVLKVISFLLKDLPDDNQYRVIFLRRDLDEVLASQDKMIARLGSKDSTDAEPLKEQYRNDIIRARLMCRKKNNFEMLEVHYRDTVNNPANTARAVSEFLGGKLDQAAMLAAVDPKLYRNRAKS
ncbi:MAG: sulfotransferase family protein [Proteobacteria bacterium]|nr:sulfotransferase family protein [Pseudomonadota bacterium]